MKQKQILYDHNNTFCPENKVIQSYNSTTSVLPSKNILQIAAMYTFIFIYKIYYICIQLMSYNINGILVFGMSLLIH